MALHSPLQLLIAFVLGFLVAWLAKRTKISGGDAGKRLPITIQLQVEEIHEEKLAVVTKQVVDALKPFAKRVLIEDDMKFRIEDVTVSLGEIDAALAAGVQEQQIELKDYMVMMVYTSLQARGSVLVTVTVQATPGSVVRIEGYPEPVEIGKSGDATVSIRVNREQLAQGFIKAQAVKGSLTEDLHIDLS